jgi:hypothetical protein
LGGLELADAPTLAYVVVSLGLGILFVETGVKELREQLQAARDRVETLEDKVEDLEDALQSLRGQGLQTLRPAPHQRPPQGVPPGTVTLAPLPPVAVSSNSAAEAAEPDDVTPGWILGAVTVGAISLIVRLWPQVSSWWQASP